MCIRMHLSRSGIQWAISDRFDARPSQMSFLETNGGSRIRSSLSVRVRLNNQCADPAVLSRL
jgi:hypothetical protein